MVRGNLIFDLDGTLVDSLDDVAEALRLAFHECGFALPLSRQQVRARLGGQIRSIIRSLTPEVSEEISETVRLTYRRCYDHGPMAHTRVYPGTRQMIDRLSSAGGRLFMVTNKPLLPTRRVLANCDLQGFCRVLCPDSPGVPMNASKSTLIGEMMRCENLVPAQCLYIGDTAEDAAAAQEAGVAMVAVLYGYGDSKQLRKYGLQACVGSVGELLGYLLEELSDQNGGTIQ